MATDKYDDAIAHFTAHPEQIRDAWEHPWVHPAGCLFLHCGDVLDDDKQGGRCGCLTQIRACDTYVGPTPKMTKEIRKDERIPLHPDEIQVEHLAAFAEWQRKIDPLGVR